LIPLRARELLNFTLALETQVQYNRNPIRCQLPTVLGSAETRGFVHSDLNLLNATQNSLCSASESNGEVGGRAELTVADRGRGFREWDPLEHWKHRQSSQKMPN